MTRIQTFCSTAVLIVSLVRPAIALDGEQLAAAHNHNDFTAMQNELQLLEANVNLLEGRLASIEAQRRNTSTYTLQDSSKTADLERAIEQVLKEVTEQ